MNTPIFDFVKGYSESDSVRAHMPGHKGVGMLGIERYDITEISGADVLYSADGVIRESENNASDLFGTAHTFYSAEGSTLAIKAMLYLAIIGRKSDTPPTVLAARNVHRAFINAAALLDITPVWLRGESNHVCSMGATPNSVRCALSKMSSMPAAVYVTSPDYLGNIADIKGISEVCRDYGVPLLVDNAHGAYLAFLDNTRHPMALGAAMCADSAHKTLPVLTGGAYLHVSKDYPEYTEGARAALSLFASTSPSYLILSSLDLCNKYLSEGYSTRLSDFIGKVDLIKDKYALDKSVEPLKIVINEPIGEALRAEGIECELSDEEYTVLMLTPENEVDLDKIDAALSRTLRGNSAEQKKISLPEPVYAISIREAVMSQHETVSVEAAIGRVCASPTVACPPAVPIAVPGEVITDAHLTLFKKYGFNYVDVVK